MFLLGAACTAPNPAFGTADGEAGADGSATSGGTATSMEPPTSASDSMSGAMSTSSAEASTGADTRAEGTTETGSIGGDCCKVDPSSPDGCGDREIRACVCDTAPSCCETWTHDCRDKAVTGCGLECAPSYDNCCVPGGTCARPEIVACVQANGDDACTAEAWAGGCVVVAEQKCDAQCSSPFDCCEEHPGPGCDDIALMTCVCSDFPDCCAAGWGPECVDALGNCAVDSCGAPAACCQEGPAGCVDPRLETCVCGIDPACCNAEWNLDCVATAIDQCTACTGDNSCDMAVPTPGCNDSQVMFDVCFVEGLPQCCIEAWDQLCVDTANAG